MKKKKLLNDNTDCCIRAKGKITSKIHTSSVIDNPFYSFRLSCTVGKDKTIDFSIICTCKDLIEKLNYNDVIIVEGYFTDSIYKNKKSKEIKILRTIYCHNLAKVVDNNHQ